MGITTRPVLGIGLVVVLGLLPVRTPAQNAAEPVIVLHSDTVTGNVSSRIFGASLPWVFSPGDSADPESGLTYPHTVEQIKDVGISLISYPAGARASLFQWQRAVGPRMRRQPEVSGLMTNPAPMDSSFGPDEFGDLLERTGAAGSVVINFGTGSAADAADFVAYMTAPIGSALVNGVDWASRRAANRHPKPYTIAYAEIGNDSDSATNMARNSWVMGDPASINAACAADKISCLYAFGGSTRFERQALVQPADWREPASVSSGEPRQTLYARNAPVAAGSESVWVDAAPWQGLSDLAAAPGDAKVYRIDYPSGAISFGDGTHGAIPPKGSRITVSYTSGPHGGFVDFYRAIKVIDPKIKVCSSVHDESFIRIMGAHHAYDCIAQHPTSAIADSRAPAGGTDDYLVHRAARATGMGGEIQRTRQFVQKYAGANATQVELLVSDYGPPGESPSMAPHFARSQAAAVLTALYLREWILAGATAATHASLTDHTFNPQASSHALVPFRDTDATGDLALLAGPGPNTIVTPAALAVKLLREHSGSSLLTCGVEGSPKLSSMSGDAVDALQIYASRDALGNGYLVVINVDPRIDIGATIRTDTGLYGPAVAVTTLASRELSDENSPTTPQLVSLSSANATLDGGSMKLLFPKHSVTGIKLTAAK